MYEKFEPTDDRDYALIVSDGLAYRETFPSEDAEDIGKAVDLLNDALKMIEDKEKWLPTDIEHEGGLSTYYRTIKAVDKHGEGVRPTASIAVRWTMLGAIESAAQRHYTPDSLRIALNAMQLAIDGWISLGCNHDKRRIQEQKSAITSFDDYCDDDMAKEGHSRCVAVLVDAIHRLAHELPNEEPNEESE